jgi:WD40 repeat protein
MTRVTNLAGGERLDIEGAGVPDPLELTLISEPVGHEDAVGWGAWASLGSQPVLATGGADATVQLWDGVSGYPRATLTGHTGTVRWGAWASLEQRSVLATGALDGTVRLWDGDSGRQRATLTGHTGMVWWGAWASLEGRPVLATGGAERSVRLWDGESEQLRATLTADAGTALWGVWASLEGRSVLAAGGGGGTVQLWDGETGQPRATLTGHTGTVRWGAWASLEGRPVLATGGDDGTVQLWDGESGQPRTKLNGHTDTVSWGAWAALQGRPVLATGGSDERVQLWDGETGQPRATLTAGAGTGLWGAWASLEGRPVLATGSYRGLVRLWEARAVRVQARRRTGYRSDTAAATRDELDRTGEAAALAEVMVARSAPPPLAIGIFGDWGSGKSVFLDLIRQQVIAAAARGPAELAHRAVRSVVFNAWHYAETDLWASLVAEIFTQLASPNATESGAANVGVAQRRQSRLAADVAAERHLHERLAAARARRDALCAARGLGWTGLSAPQQGELGAAVTAIAPDLGKEVAEVYTATRSTRPWLRIRLLQARRVVAALHWPGALALLVLVGGIVWMSTPAGHTALANLVAWATSVVGGLGLVGVVAASWPRLRAITAAIHQAAVRVNEIGEAQRRQVDLAIEVADAEVAGLQRQLQDLTASGALAGMITDRAAAGDYRDDLGLMTRIREDFRAMATLLQRASEERATTDTTPDSAAAAPRPNSPTTQPDAADDELPQIDRIVLYIDDLDRCPPTRVVQVLEAIHLLLAVPLFVVVVAVDPRWLLQALQVHYRDMLIPTTLHDHPAATPPSTTWGQGIDPDDPELWASNPAQYLEKIFQIVFTLPPLSAPGFQRMLDDLTTIRDETTTMPPAPTPVEQPANDQSPASEPIGGRLYSSTPWDTAVELPAARELIRVDPYALREDERTLMRLLGPPLITNPRAVKRLTNSYGLLAATQRHTSSHNRTGSLETGEPDGTAMVLLAAVIGFPELGPAFFTHLRHSAAQPAPPTWSDFLASLHPREPAPGQDSWSNSADPGMSAATAQRWRQMLGALTGITTAAAGADIPLPAPLTAWAQWAVPVGRLSFPTGRAVTTLTY